MVWMLKYLTDLDTLTTFYYTSLQSAKQCKTNTGFQCCTRGTWDMKHVARAATDLRHTVVDDGALLREGCAHPAHHAPRPRLPVRLRPESIILLLEYFYGETWNILIKHSNTQTYTISFFSLGHLSSFLIVFVTPNLRDSKKYLN